MATVNFQLGEHKCHKPITSWHVLSTTIHDNCVLLTIVQTWYAFVAVEMRYVLFAHSTAEDDVYDVYGEVFTMADSWGRIAVGLRLPPRMKSLIAKKHPNNPEDCLLAVVEEWLKGVHNVEKYGHPSWRALVQAVADPMGGANSALAHSIAAKHSGTCNNHPYVTECPVVTSVFVSLVTSAPGRKSDANGTVIAHQAQSKRIVHDCIAHTVAETSSLT